MSKNNMQSPFIENKHHVKLYKRGKQWVAMGVTMATLIGVSFVTSTTANAEGPATNDPASSISQSNTPEQPAANTDGQSGTTASSPANTGNESTGNLDTNQGAPVQVQPKDATPADNTANRPAQPAAQKAPVTAPTPAPVPAAEATTQAVGPTVTTVDKSGAASTDPANTGSSNETPTVVTGEDVAKNFVAGGSNGATTPKINGDTVDLTNPTDSTYVQNGVIVAKDAVDFTSDFNLNATVNVKWDSTMGGWLGGDGMAVAFQPVSMNDAMTKGGYGSGMGLVRNTDGTISYIISTDAIQQSPATNDGQPFTQIKNWVIYQSGSNSNQATGGVYDTGVALPQGSSAGSLSYSFDVTYKADTKQLATNIVDSNNQVVKTYTQTIADDQIGKNYLLGVTAATASSKAAYSVTINKYSYVPADAKLNITSNMPNVAQSNINGTPGQVIAFYQEGTAKPTTDGNGNAVSVAYTVPAVNGYTLSPKFITLTAGGENIVAINYLGNQVSNATVTIPTNKGPQTVANVSGRVGDTVHISVPTIQGYTADKTMVDATVNADKTITVVSPKAQTGDAGYVTYTGDTQTVIMHIGDNTWTTTGASDTPINYDQQAILALVPKGYTINANTPKDVFETILKQSHVPTTFDDDTTKDQTFTLYLQPEEDFNHATTTRTIHFVDSTGKTVSPDVVQTVNWVEAVNAATGKPVGVYSPIDWYTSLTAPTVDGYKPDTSSIAEVHPMISDDPVNASDITVTYTADTQTMVVHVGDKTWTTTGPSDSPINYDQQTILALFPEGYTMGPNTSKEAFDNILQQLKASTTFDHDTADNQSITLPYSPAEDFNHTTTTRTIHFVDSKGNTVAPDVVQTVNWVQPVNAATGKPTDVYSPMDWYTSVTAPTIAGYTPGKANVAAEYPMITDAPAKAQDVTVVYTGDPKTANVTIPSNLGSQTVPNVKGNVGDTVTVQVPTINGYTADKSTVVATVNPDGTITVNDPKTETGDAGYVTYTSNASNVPNPGNNDNPTDQPGDNGNSGNVDDNPQTGDLTSPTDDTPQPGTVVTKPDSTNGTDATPGVNATKPAGSNTSSSTDRGTAVADPTGSATKASAAANQQSATNLSSPVSTSGQVAGSQLATSQPATGQAETKQSTKGQLPQTNDQSTQAETVGLLGLIMLSLLSLLGLKRKETDDK